MGAKLPKELRLNNLLLDNCSPKCFNTSQWRCPYPVYLAFKWVLALYTVSAFIYMVIAIQQVHINHPEQSHNPMVYLTSWAYLMLMCHFVVAALITTFCNRNRMFNFNTSPDPENPSIWLKSMRVTRDDTTIVLYENTFPVDAGTLNSAVEYTGKGSPLYRELTNEHGNVIPSGTEASPTVNLEVYSSTEETRQSRRGVSFAQSVSNQGRISGKVEAETNFGFYEMDDVKETYGFKDSPLNTTNLETRQPQQCFSITSDVSNHGTVSGDSKEETNNERGETDAIQNTNEVKCHHVNITEVKKSKSEYIDPSDVFIEPQLSYDDERNSGLNSPVVDIETGDEVEHDEIHNDRAPREKGNSDGRDCENRQEPSTNCNLDFVLPWYCKLSWVLANISSTFSLVVTTIYFGFVFKESFREIVNDVNTHILNAVFAILDSFISSRPTRVLHVVYSLGFGLVYLIFSVVFWAVDSNNVIYPGLTDWNNPGVSLAVCGAIAVLIVIFHSINFGMYIIRIAIFNGCCVRREG